MTNDKLLLNDDKTEFLMIGTKQQLAKVNIDHILIGDSVIRPKWVVKNLGTWFDSTLSMNSHVNNTCSNAFYYSFTHLSQAASTFATTCSMAGLRSVQISCIYEEINYYEK